MIKVQRSYPFDYYSIRQANLTTNSIIQKVVLRSLNLIENFFKLLANTVIGCANMLKLYRLTKVEIIAETRPQLIAENQVIAATAFLFSIITGAIIGTGKISNFGMEVTKFYQAPDRNLMGIVKNRITLKLLGERRVDQAIRVLNTGLSIISTIQFAGFVFSIIPYSSYLPFSGASSRLMNEINKPFNAPQVKVPIAIWSAYSIIRKSCEGIKTCYDNAYRNPLESAKWTVVHLVNIAATLGAFQYSFQATPQANSAS